MGYTVELVAIPPGEVLRALAAADPVPPSVPLPDETRERWPDLAPKVAQALRQGGGQLVAEYAHYVAGVVRAVGYDFGTLDHTSSGGDEFRRRFLSIAAVARYGRNAVANLFNRALGGLSWYEYPMLGHLTVEEVMAAVEHMGDDPPPDDPEHPSDQGELLVLDEALTRSARFGLELHTIYG
jgi:hypothetical protein